MDSRAVWKYRKYKPLFSHSVSFSSHQHRSLTSFSALFCSLHRYVLGSDDEQRWRRRQRRLHVYIFLVFNLIYTIRRDAIRYSLLAVRSDVCSLFCSFHDSDLLLLVCFIYLLYSLRVYFVPLWMHFKWMHFEIIKQTFCELYSSVIRCIYSNWNSSASIHVTWWYVVREWIYRPPDSFGAIGVFALANEGKRTERFGISVCNLISESDSR